MYVCGITPYDATHLGHAATYVTFDLVGRALRDAGHDVRLRAERHRHRRPPARARRARRQGLGRPGHRRRSALFARGHDRPRGHRPGPLHRRRGVDPVDRQGGRGARGERHRIPAGRSREGAAGRLLRRRPSSRASASVSHLRRTTRCWPCSPNGAATPTARASATSSTPCCGGRAATASRRGPAAALGDGRPGWHIECATIALQHLGVPVRRPGRRHRPGLPAPRDERRPRRGARPERSRSPGPSSTRRWSGYDGEKMSKSKGNLVLVSELRARRGRPDGDPAGAARPPLPHDWEWTDDVLAQARGPAGDLAGGRCRPTAVPTPTRRSPRCEPRLADDLDTPGALAAIDAWAARSLAGGRVRRGRPGHRGTYLRRPARRPPLATRTAQAGGMPSSPRRRR